MQPEPVLVYLKCRLNYMVGYSRQKEGRAVKFNAN